MQAWNLYLLRVTEVRQVHQHQRYGSWWDCSGKLQRSSAYCSLTSRPAFVPNFPLKVPQSLWDEMWQVKCFCWTSKGQLSCQADFHICGIWACWLLQVVVVDMHNNNAVNKRPMKAEALCVPWPLILFWVRSTLHSVASLSVRSTSLCCSTFIGFPKKNIILFRNVTFVGDNGGSCVTYQHSATKDVEGREPVATKSAVQATLMNPQDNIIALKVRPPSAASFLFFAFLTRS